MPPPPPDRCQWVEISSATAQGFLQQILKFPKILLGLSQVTSYHEKKVFHKGYFGQNKDFKGNFDNN